MAKALVITGDDLATPARKPLASQLTAAPTVAAVPAPAPANANKGAMAPLQIRIPPAEAKAIKRAALEADQTISDFMLACFHAYMK